MAGCVTQFHITDNPEVECSNLTRGKSRSTKPLALIEGEESGFKNIPISVYWCIVTLTTVGYGDIAPVTPYGQLLASIIMILGYGIIAVPTGIVSAEYAASHKSDSIQLNSQSCSNCNASKHQDNASFCHKCGEPLHYE